MSASPGRASLGRYLQRIKARAWARSEVVRQRLRQDVAPGHAGQAADSPAGRKLLEAARGLCAVRGAAQFIYMFISVVYV